jgi:hypothetical protein
LASSARDKSCGKRTGLSSRWATMVVFSVISASPRRRCHTVFSESPIGRLLAQRRRNPARTSAKLRARGTFVPLRFTPNMRKSG